MPRHDPVAAQTSLSAVRLPPHDVAGGELGPVLAVELVAVGTRGDPAAFAAHSRHRVNFVAPVALALKIR